MAVKDPTSRRFDIIKKRLGQQATSGIQEGRDALRRQFARGGLSSSGSAIKAEQQLLEKGRQAKQQAGETVEMAELAERQRQQEIAAERGFVSSEREASQQFAAEQAGLGREFASGERRASQRFSHGERIGSQAFAKKEALKQRSFSRAMQQSAQIFQNKLVKKQMSQQWDMFKKQFKEDKRINDFNMGMAQAQFDKKGMMDYMRNPALFSFGDQGQFSGGQTGFGI